MLCGVVGCGVVWCGVVWCGVPKELLPRGNGEDVLHEGKMGGSPIKAANAWAVTPVCKAGASTKCTITHGPSKVDLSGVPLTEGLVRAFGLWFSVPQGAAGPLDRAVLRTAYPISLWVSPKELITKPCDEMGTWLGFWYVLYFAWANQQGYVVPWDGSVDNGGHPTLLPSTAETLRSTAGSLLAIVKPTPLFPLWKAPHSPQQADLPAGAAVERGPA